MLDMWLTCFKLNLLLWLFSWKIFSFLLILLCFFLLLIFSGGLVGLFWVVGRRYLKDGVNEEAEVWLFVANAEVKVLIDLVEGLWINALGEVRIFLCPVFKNVLESRANSGGFFEKVFAVLIEEELETIGNKHEVEDEIFVFWLVAGDANNIPDLF
jgi:hypothetical protein